MQLSDKQKKILMLLSDGQFHSGTTLAEALCVSRSAICKQFKNLSELGIQYSAVSGRGYRLEYPLELLDLTTISQGLSQDHQHLISSIEIHDSINSTNSYLVDYTQQQAKSGVVCFAEHQSAGKGRRGRTWVSPYGSNLYMSILWRFQQGGITATAGLSLAVGVAVIRALRQHHIHDIGLKWPNDIYSQGKKLGGILIEVSGETDGPCSAVIGLGLNLFLPASEAQTITQAWTDLSNVKGAGSISRNQLAASLLSHILDVVNGFETIGIQPYLDEWRNYDCLQGQTATLYIGQQHIDGIVEGIDNNGLLLIKRTDGTIQAFASGEVSFSGNIL